MRKTTVAALAACAALLAACDKSEDAQKAPVAPKRPPMQLDPSPPMSAQDIDAIVGQHTGRNAPAATNNQQGEEGNQQ